MGPEGSNFSCAALVFSDIQTWDYWRLLEITAEYWRLLETTGNYWINLGLDEAKRDVCDRNTTLLKNKSLKTNIIVTSGALENDFLENLAGVHGRSRSWQTVCQAGKVAHGQ